MYPIKKLDKLPPKREKVETLEILKQSQFAVKCSLNTATANCDCQPRLNTATAN